MAYLGFFFCRCFLTPIQNFHCFTLRILYRLLRMQTWAASLNIASVWEIILSLFLAPKMFTRDIEDIMASRDVICY